MEKLFPQIYENWEEYNERKTISGANPELFSCDEAWEIFYLKKKISEAVPVLEKIVILEAIEFCCRNKTEPLSRTGFIESVLRRLMNK